PAVVRTTDSVRRRDAVRQRRAAMRAELADQSEAAAPVFEQHEVLAQKADAFRPAVAHLGLGDDRQPIAPEQIAHRRPRPDARQTVVLFRFEHYFFGTSRIFVSAISMRLLSGS